MAKETCELFIRKATWKRIWASYDLTYKTSLRFSGFGTLEHCGSHVDNLGLGETGPRRNGQMEQNFLVIPIFRNIGTSS